VSVKTHSHTSSTPLWVPHTNLSNTSLPHSLVIALLSSSSLEQGKATLESLAPWKKRPLGMNSNKSSSKAMPSYYIYSCCVMILIYELVYSLCVMRVAHLTLFLNTHITYIIRFRAKLRWRFIVLSGMPMSFTCRSVGSKTWGDLGSFYIRKHGAWVWRDR
jgi:hypothetical protein